MSRLIEPRSGLFDALPGHVLRSVDHAALQPLVPTGPRARILAVMDELGVPVRTVCYECRLRSSDSRVDVAVELFMTRIADVDGVLGRLGQRHRHDPAWRRCLELLAAWSSPASLLAPRIPFVCVAFDAPDHPATLPAPALSLCVDRDFFARQLGFPTPRVPAIEIAALADTCYRRLHHEAFPGACWAQIEQCLAGTRVIARHVSYMLSRTPATCKLDVRVPVDGVASLLRRIGWPGAVPEVVAGIRELMPWPGDVQLNLVVHPEPRLEPGREPEPSLEVEFLTGRKQATTGDRLALLQRLVDAGHCDPTKAEVLQEAWVRPVSRHGAGLIVARSWYLKVRFDRDGVAEAKAYLGLMPRTRWNPQMALQTPSAGAAL